MACLPFNVILWFGGNYLIVSWTRSAHLFSLFSCHWPFILLSQVPVVTLWRRWQPKALSWAGGAGVGIQQPGPRAGLWPARPPPQDPLTPPETPVGWRGLGDPWLSGVGTVAWLCGLRDRCEREMLGVRLGLSGDARFKMCILHTPFSFHFRLDVCY